VRGLLRVLRFDDLL
ncbi:calcium-dependent protein kinase CDPK9, partial [Toxoplasma gondii RUB]